MTLSLSIYIGQWDWEVVNKIIRKKACPHIPFGECEARGYRESGI